MIPCVGNKFSTFCRTLNFFVGYYDKWVQLAFAVAIAIISAGSSSHLIIKNLALVVKNGSIGVMQTTTITARGWAVISLSIAQGAGAVGNAVLSKKDQLKYDEKKKKATTRFESDPCQTFLKSKGFDVDKVREALEKQVAYDGLKSTISLEDAGVTEYIGVYGKTTSVATELGRSGAYAATGSWKEETKFNVYYGNKKGFDHILHEALHSATRLGDPALGAKLGIVNKKTGEPLIKDGGPTEEISKVLKKNGC